MEGLLCHTCTIQARTEAAIDSYGDQAETWAATSTKVPCRFFYDRHTEYLEGQGKVIREHLKVALPASVTVTANDYRITTTAAGFSGTYEVEEVFSRYAKASAHHTAAKLRKVA